MFKLVLEKAEEPEIKLPISAGSSKKRESSRKNIYFYFTDYAKVFDCVDHNKLWKILKEFSEFFSGIPISFKNFPQFVVIHTVNEAEVICFSGIPLMIQQMLAT